jgi:hypothetical protein
MARLKTQISPNFLLPDTVKVELLVVRKVH